MAQDLKSENTKSVFYIVAVAVLCSVLIQMEITSITELRALATLGVSAAMGTAISVVVAMLTNLLPRDVKHKLVFLRWKNEMPGCRVHLLCKKDQRIEYAKVLTKWPEVFRLNIDGATRNSRWYQQIYKTVKDKDEVKQAHRDFLLYRDTFSALLIILLGALGCYMAGEIPLVGQIKPTVILVLVAFLLLAMRAAQVAGKRFVVNAVAAA